ncbi:hypothetical protein HDV06_001784 [Boothiomyces sp. JEL0866]|nr:hypothetical protein HDV06_001784 [Boothiomyces sp. JEL0866]
MALGDESTADSNQISNLIKNWDVNKSESLAKLNRMLANKANRAKLQIHDIFKRLRLCLVDPTKETRSASYQILEKMVTENCMEYLFKKYHFDVFILRTLSRDSRYDSERQQAMLLLVKIIEFPEGPNILPYSIIRMFVSLADQQDDRLRNTAIELLCELAIRIPDIISYSGGLKSIFMSIMEGPEELLPSVVKTFMYLIDEKDTRVYVRPHVELEMVISQFADAYTARGAYPIDKLKICTAIIEEILSSWTGLYFYCVGNRQAIYAIIEALSLPNEEIRVMLSVIQNILLNMLQKILGNQTEHEKLDPEACIWLKQFKGMRLMIFIDCGLIEKALIGIVQQGESTSRSLAINLLSDILTTCAKELPHTYDEKVQSLPTLFASAADFHNETIRHFSREKLATIFKLHLEEISRNSSSLARHLSTYCSNSENENQAELIRMRLSITMDDVQFKSLLNDSEVLGVKDYTKWNWDAISSLVKGPLLNPKRFDELVRTTKFASRMIQFLKPSSRQFVDTPIENSGKIILACSDLLCNLACTNAGLRFLSESRLFAEIVERLAKLADPSNLQIDPLFSKDKLDNCLAREYFTFLGKLQRSPDGEKLFEEHNIWSLYYQLTELRGRDDIIKWIINTGNYSIDGHARAILSKLLSSGYKEMRLHATNFFNTLLEECPDTLYEWAPEVLVPQLFDSSELICGATINILKKGCKNARFLESLVNCRPNIEHLSALDNSLLLKMMECSAGFNYLTKNEYTKQELTYWLEYGVYQYVAAVELYMRSFDNQDDKSVIEFPMHLFRSLAQSPEGCRYLETNGELQTFIKILKSEVENAAVEYFKLKAAIWALGNMASSSFGYKYLAKHDFLPTLMRIIRKSESLSVRGTCLFSFTLICQSSAGADALFGLGWESNNLVCLPKDIGDLLELKHWDFEGSWPAKRSQTFTPLHYTLNATEAEVLKCFGNLTNHIIATAASRRLAVLKQQSPQTFTSPALYLQVLRLTCNYSIRIPTRRYIQELFDKIVWDKTALQEIDRMNGLRFTTPMVYQEIVKTEYIPAPSAEEKEIEVENTTPQYVPQKTIYGF